MTVGMQPGVSDERPRILSEADCHEIAQRLVRFASGGGHTATTIVSQWRAYVRWARNQITAAGEVCTPHVQVSRNLHGAISPAIYINETTDDALVAAARRAERLAQLNPQKANADLITSYELEQPIPTPRLFSETTYQMGAAQRAAAARQLIHSATDAGMLSAGYLEISAHSQAIITSWGTTLYCQYTQARYSVTVRDPKGTGSGWAGVDWPDWNHIEGEKLSALALEKCVNSRNPVAVEPGRYTTILEPQAVGDFIALLFGGDNWSNGLLERTANENLTRSPYPFWRAPGFSRLGDRVIDERITIGADPTDPALGFPPFSPHNYYFAGNPESPSTEGIGSNVYHAVNWIEQGVLVNLAYERRYALDRLGRNTGLPKEGAFRMSVTGPTTSTAEMIASTTRGLFVTRFSNVDVIDEAVTINRGYTRDGLWLIENGKISKPVKNLAFTESVLSALNNVEQLGVPQRVFHPVEITPNFLFALPQPRFVPALKIRDFSFTALADAV